MVVDCPAHGHRVGRCKLSWRDERVRRPGRSNKGARSVFVAMPRPARLARCARGGGSMT